MHDLVAQTGEFEQFTKLIPFQVNVSRSKCDEKTKAGLKE